MRGKRRISVKKKVSEKVILGGGEEREEEYQIVTFEIGGTQFGVEIGKVREVVECTEVTPVPKAKKYVEGIINLRGRILPVISLRKRLELPDVENTSETVILVLEIEQRLFAVIVDKILDVVKISHRLVVKRKDDIIEQIRKEFVKEIIKLKDDLIILLYPEKLVQVESNV